MGLCVSHTPIRARPPRGRLRRTVRAGRSKHTAGLSLLDFPGNDRADPVPHIPGTPAQLTSCFEDTRSARAVDLMLAHFILQSPIGVASINPMPVQLP
jgi:hypothetical protein